MTNDQHDTPRIVIEVWFRQSEQQRWTLFASSESRVEVEQIIHITRARHAGWMFEIREVLRNEGD